MLLPVGIDSFEDVIKNQLYFVDKSLFIKALLDDITTKAVVFTRPRRFGKTLNLSMLHHFLANEVYGQSTKGLFDHLSIARCGDEYMKHQGQYPVIAITLKDVCSSCFEDAIGDIAILIRNLYQEHSYLLNSTKLSEQQKKDVERISATTKDISELKLSVQSLAKYLYLHHGVKPWLLIDEYDTPIQYAYVDHYYDEMIQFMRGFMGSSLKTNPYLDKAVITGILRIAKESLFSGVNNLEVYSLLSSQYSEYFGFTENEMTEILDKANLSDKSKEIKEWYNGYQIGESVLYNPWSIAKCIKEKGETRPYWVNTSSNQLIKDLLKQSPLSFKREFEQLIQGGCIEKLIDDNMVFHYLNNNPSSVWNLLLMSGYLKIKSSELTYQGPRANLCIPNKEIRNLYFQIIEQWLANGNGIEWYNEFIDSLLTGNMIEFKRHLEKIIIQITSYHDFAKEPEAFYQGLMLGFTASLHGAKAYEIKSNREAGLGRFDIMLIPQDTSKLGVVLELKVAQENEPLLNAAKKALQQINDKHYVAEIQSRGIAQSIKIGIGFRGKTFELDFAVEG